MNKDTKEKIEPVKLEVDNFNWIIPECCREDWSSCPHVVRRTKPSKRNVGL